MPPIGYFGHLGTIPWNASERSIVPLRTEFVDRMPRPQDVAEIVLLDPTDGYAERLSDTIRA